MSRRRLVVLSGAGISAESGLKTFRDADGLWEGHAIEEVASPAGWRARPQRVLDFYNARRQAVLAAEPNAAHRELAHLESRFDVRIVTQNVDDLHERAGSTRVLHLHGEILKMRSERNPRLQAEIRGDIRLGDLAPDGGQYRPDIVWFGEAVPLIGPAAEIVRQADLFVVIGTSLVVYPAADLIHVARPDIPKFLIDRKIPPHTPIPNLTLIEQPATIGISELIARLDALDSAAGS